LLGRSLIFIVLATVSLLSRPARPEARENIDTLHDLFSALQRCWRPPPIERAFAGMTVVVRFSLKTNGDLIGEPVITFLTHRAPEEIAKVYRDAVISTLGHCLPLPLSETLGGAVAGRPLTVRFVDRRQRLLQARFGFAD
jgi:hypothetical protein